METLINPELLKLSDAPRKVLFILKRRENFDPLKHETESLKCCLFNSISYVNDMLISLGLESNIEIAIDNNCIDRLVTKHKPTHVIIEALWVVPEKFEILKKLHPTVVWIIRLHSAIPFLSIESSVSMKWIYSYCNLSNVYVAVNDPRLFTELCIINSPSKVIYLPNYYPLPTTLNTLPKDLVSKDTLNISCFGAIRPFKNILTQALAAIKFCKKINKGLRFYINSERNELNGSQVYTNIKHVFDGLNDAKFTLIEHPWSNRDDFLKICEIVDIGMQVSFTETFNIVSADVLSKSVPIVGSAEIPWLVKEYVANPVDTDDIVAKLVYTFENPDKNIQTNTDSLLEYIKTTREIWENIFKV